MTYFERRGVELQERSETVAQANSRMDYSCQKCCQRGINIDCDHCAIKQTNIVVVTTLKSIQEARQKRFDEQFVKWYLTR